MEIEYKSAKPTHRTDMILVHVGYEKETRKVGNKNAFFNQVL